MSALVPQLHQFLRQTCNLRALFLFDYWPADNSYPRMETICSLISPSIKHLQIRVKNVDEMKFILHNLKHLSSVTFQYSQMFTFQRQQLLRSLGQFERFSSTWNSENALHIWLGKIKDVQ